MALKNNFRKVQKNYASSLEQYFCAALRKMMLLLVPF